MKSADRLITGLHANAKCCIRAPQPAWSGASGCSSGVEHNLAKVGVEGSNPFARSSHRLPLTVTDDEMLAVPFPPISIWTVEG